MDFKLELQFTCWKMKIHFLLLVILLSTASLLEGQSSTPVPADPCNRGPFCLDGSLAANPENCTTYYDCGSGIWYLRPCPDDTLFDNISMRCTEPEKATCQSCPPFSWTTPPPLTIEPGTCDNLTECEFGKNYPDRSNCIMYYHCQAPTYLLHMPCAAGFVFDIYVAECVQPTNEFTWDVCYYRCVTPPPPTTESTQNTASITTSTTSSTIADSTAFITSTASSASVVLTTTYAPETTSYATETSDATETTSDATETTSDATETTSDATETTSDAAEATSENIETNTNDEILLLLSVIIVVVLIIIAIILIAVCCIQQKNQSKMESESGDIHVSLCHRTYLYIVSGKRSSSSPSKEKKRNDKNVSLTQMNPVTFENTHVTPISDGVIDSPEYEEISLKFEAKRTIYTELWKHGSSEADTTNGFARGLQPLNALSLEEEQRCIVTTKPTEKPQPTMTRYKSPMDELL